MTARTIDNECTACGWSTEKQKRCHYPSHIKLFYGASQRGVWAIGSDVILKDRPNGPPKTEVKTIEYLAHHTEIPVPTVLREWVDNENRYMILMERVKRQTLEDAWPTLSQDEKETIADQVAAALGQLRSFESASMQDIDQGPIYSGWLFGDPKKPFGPFSSDSELWDGLRHWLHQPSTKVFPERALAAFRKRLPNCRPYVLTHGDLNLGNIMVENGRLTGILDWEYAGYFPVWWEYVALHIGLSETDAEWKKLVRQRIEPHDDGKQFWLDLYSLRDYPNLDEDGQKLLKELSSDN
ncbi:kinase-like protein [Penicillium mononematosum]|uniref:kinase-like protein n=1 Tax=Penicillium mononematosum TaxID=268346 RepID=UPI00254860DF|nr:kinase-like protein [Penicillium mononematosum]KAJ6189814.1 kinase-like protein [Penicillium mononematosum]